MAKEYKVGEKYYLPVTVYNDGDEGDNSVIEIEFRDGLYGFRNFVRNEPDLLLTATEIAENGLGRRCGECLPMYDEVVAERNNLKADLTTQKEVNEGLKAKIAENADTISRLSANKVALTEEVGRLRETVADRTIDVQHLAEENEKLNKRNKYLESEKKRKPIVHVLTNDGHVYAFTSSGNVSVKYHTELNILMIEDGEKTIAGFSRGDKPGNLSAWWMG